VGGETGSEEDTASDQTFDASAFRQNMERGLRILAEDTFRTLNESGSRTLLQQIVTLAFAQIVDSASHTIVAAAAKGIWKENEPKRVRRVFDTCLRNGNTANQAQVLLDQAWVEDESARILEDLLLLSK